MRVDLVEVNSFLLWSNETLLLDPEHPVHYKTVLYQLSLQLLITVLKELILGRVKLQKQYMEVIFLKPAK